VAAGHSIRATSRRFSNEINRNFISTGIGIDSHCVCGNVTAREYGESECLERRCFASDEEIGMSAYLVFTRDKVIDQRESGSFGGG
jgi:hypothetical protein